MSAQASPGKLAIYTGKITIYISDPLGLGIRRIEATQVDVSLVRYAQFAQAVQVDFMQRKMRRARRIVDSFRPTTIVLEGWGHPDPVAFMDKRQAETNKAILARSPDADAKATAFFHSTDDFRAELSAYVASGAARVYHDFRGHDTCDVSKVTP